MTVYANISVRCSVLRERFARMRKCRDDIAARRRGLLRRCDGGHRRLPNQHMLIAFDTRFGQITNASVEREHDQNRGQAALASARRLRGEDHANDSHASGTRRGSSALQLPGTRGRGTGRSGRGRHSSHPLGETRVRGACAEFPDSPAASESECDTRMKKFRTLASNVNREAQTTRVQSLSTFRFSRGFRRCSAKVTYIRVYFPLLPRVFIIKRILK